MHSAWAGEGRLPRSNAYPMPGEAAFHHAVAAGKPCEQKYALMEAGADGLSYFPIQIPTKVLFPGVLLCFIISFKPSTFIKGYIHRGCCASPPGEAKLAKSKTAGNRKINTVECFLIYKVVSL